MGKITLTEAEGLIYFGNEETLLKATTFGVAFIAEDGGALQVTWGTRGSHLIGLAIVTSASDWFRTTIHMTN